MTGAGLELRAVGVRYGGRTALDGVDLVMDAGEQVCLVGPNGAGKSSLLACVTGLMGERRGTVLLDDVPLEEWSRETLARRMAVVPQQVVLPFAARVEEVVALGRLPHEHPFLGAREVDRQAVARAIELVGIGQLVGRDVRELSLGERQMVLLAMAVAQSAPLLILDEPTVHLDLRHQVQVMELLRGLNRREGTTILAVLHDLRLAAHFFPRVVVLDAGRVVADGPPTESLSPDRIRTVFGVDPALV